MLLAHWGRTYRPITRRQHHAAADVRAAGPDLVVGHHPHISCTPSTSPTGRPCCSAWATLRSALAGDTRGAACRPTACSAVAELAPGEGVVALELRVLHVDNREVRYQSALVSDPDFLSPLVDSSAGWRSHGKALRWER